jgi:hypothetical protein
VCFWDEAVWGWDPLNPGTDQRRDPGPRAPARAHFGLGEGVCLGHGAKRASRRCSLREPRWVSPGRAAGPLPPWALSDRGPPSSSLPARAPPLSRPHPGPPPTPPPARAPPPPRPSPEAPPRQRARAAHFLKFRTPGAWWAAAHPKSLA